MGIYMINKNWNIEWDHRLFYFINRNQLNDPCDKSRRYKFRIIVFGIIPMKMICDWNGNNFMMQEYWIGKIKIFQVRHKTLLCSLT